MTKMVMKEDIEALWDYCDNEAPKYFGLSYQDGIREMTEWLEGNGPRPGSEEDE